MTSVKPSPPARPARKNREWLHGLLMSAPAVVGLIVFVGIPFGYAVVLSFYNVRLGSPLEPSFFGVEHYWRLFTDPDLSGPFLRALLNNLTFAVVVVPAPDRPRPGPGDPAEPQAQGASRVFRSFFFMPVVFPMALVAVIWRLILARSEQGMLNSLLDTLSFGNWGAFDWLGDSATAHGLDHRAVRLAGRRLPDGHPAGRPPADPHRALRGRRSWTGPPAGSSSATSPCPASAALWSSSPCSPRCCPSASSTRCTSSSEGGLSEDATRTVMYQAVTTAFDQKNIGLASAITVVFFLIVVVLSLIQRRVVRPDNED